MQVCKVVLQPFLSPAEHLCPRAGAAYANVVALLLNAELLTQSERVQTFLKAVYTYHSLLDADMSHAEVKEGSSPSACLPNAITSSNLPLELLA